ncbi:MAG: hypothetical protein WCY10_00765 [Candidatus Omnitrophota bacterium]
MKKTIKDYIVTYRSNEHYEVLGWVRASTARAAVNKARRELKSEIDRYGVINATIAEWRGVENIRLSDS